MSTDNYLLITDGAVVYEGQGEGPCPYSGQQPLALCRNIAAAILFCENYKQREIVEYGYTLTKKAQKEFCRETGLEEKEEEVCPTCHQSIIKIGCRGLPN